MFVLDNPNKCERGMLVVVVLSSTAVVVVVVVVVVVIFMLHALQPVHLHP